MSEYPRKDSAKDREPPERRSTLKPSLTFESFRRRDTGSSSKPTKEKDKGPYQEHYPCYEGLTWEVLRNYLVNKWPSIRLEEHKVWMGCYRARQRRAEANTMRVLQELDNWLFEIPERLTMVRCTPAGRSAVVTKISSMRSS